MSANNSMTAHIVVVSQHNKIVDVWSGDGDPMTREDAQQLADWGNAVPGNDRLHQAASVTVQVPEVVTA